jgi:heavy metal translocating P-type ATPase
MLWLDDDHQSVWGRRQYAAIAILATIAIVSHLVLRWHTHPWADGPLWLALALGGGPVVVELAAKAWRREFGSDLLAGLSIVTSVLVGEYLAGTFVVLMVGTGETIERLAVRRASSVLQALARRMPTIAHRREDHQLRDVAVEAVEVGDTLVVFPHEVCPADGVVVDGHGTMDESFLTGEPYQMSKAPGAEVISGALNGESALTIRVARRARDSRYAQIMKVMQETEQRRPRMRRLADQLGAWYTPLALTLATIAGLASGDPARFLAVLVVATPCPLLIAIPVAILGAISLAARRSILIKDPTVLEQIDQCSVLIFDKTGTLTYGQPRLTEVRTVPGWSPDHVLRLAASVERYSKHPLARAVVQKAQERSLALPEASQIREQPGTGLTGLVEGRTVAVTGRNHLDEVGQRVAADLAPSTFGLEAVVLVDGQVAAVFRFRDEPRREARHFISHLRPQHGIARVLLVSGDREAEVRYLAQQVGIEEVYAAQSPEQKVDLVRRETARGKTLFVGDGINDAPALAAATVGVAFGTANEATTAAAGAVVMDSSLERVDELMHLGSRLRRIALQSAVGGMAASLLGMLAAACGWLPPVAGAIFQELIDVAAVMNATRTALPPRTLSDYQTSRHDG